MTGRAQIALLGGWLAGLAGCTTVHGGGEPEGAAGGAAPRTSLCTPERDPRGVRCEERAGDISSPQAVAMARELVPDEPLIHLRSDSVASLNLDGLDTGWEFRFEERGTGDWLWVRVDLEGARRDRTEGHPCYAGVGMRALDSKSVVPHAVLQLEAVTGRPFVGNLYLEQDGCGQFGSEQHHVILMPEGPPFATYFARYRDDGRFIGLVGPCAGSDVYACAESEAP